jgi:diguanylate cyclase (GGDEF)-like protein/PAS domain S-box-containing protein
MSEISHELLLESLFDAVYYVDLERRITFWNRAAERITGFGRAEVLGSCCADNILRHIDDSGRELCIDGCPLAETLNDGQVREANVYLHHKQGHRVPVSIRVSPVTDGEGKIVGGIEVFSDGSRVAQMLEELEQLKQEAYVDELTRIGNRRYCEMILHTRIYERRSFNVPFGIIFLDIDHFKRFNDTHGHQTGDRVLKMVSTTVHNVIRELDTVTRWGGEELVAVLPNITEAALRSVAERVRLFIERCFIMAGEQKLKVTASLGATMARDDDTVDSIVHRADTLMYAGKIAGRNRVTMG